MVWIIGIFSFILFALIAIVYFLILKPKFSYDWHLKNIKNLGYKVHAFPFSALRTPGSKMYIEDQKKYGDPYETAKKLYPQYDLIISNMYDKIMIQLISPELIQGYYAPDKHYQFPKSPRLMGCLERAVGRGLFLSEGQEWKRKKKILNSIFTFDFIKGLAPDIVSICDQSFQDFDENYFEQMPENKGKSFVQYKLLDLMNIVFSRVILECFFGAEHNNQKYQGEPICMLMNKLITESRKQIRDPARLIFGSKFLDLGIRKSDRNINEQIKIFKGWGLKIINERIKESQNKSEKEKTDLLDELIKNYKQGNLTQKQILDEFGTFYFAAMETTAHFTQMMIFYIAQHPSVEEKLREQIEQFMKQDDYRFENLKKMKYLEGIQRETTRMYGPVNIIFFREAAKDTYIKDIPIKKGTILTIRPKGNQYSETYFKQPMKFRPERWQTECANLPPYVEGGFSAGARTCIGKHLALLESKICVIRFMKHYKKIILPEEKIKMEFQFVYSPENVKIKLILND